MMISGKTISEADSEKIEDFLKVGEWSEVDPKQETFHQQIRIFLTAMQRSVKSIQRYKDLTNLYPYTFLFAHF